MLDVTNETDQIDITDGRTGTASDKASLISRKGKWVFVRIILAVLIFASGLGSGYIFWG